MTRVLALTSNAAATDELLGVLDEFDALLSIGDRLLIFEGEAGLASLVQEQPGVMATVSEDEARSVAASVEELIADSTSAAVGVAALLGVGLDAVDANVVRNALSWLLAFSPEVEAEKTARSRDGETWDFDGFCQRSDIEQPMANPPESPLRSPRFAGDEELERCLLGQHRMMKPEESRAVLKIQLALLDLGYLLPSRGADGKFGSETGEAVSAFKRDNTIAPSDPVVGPKTMARLDELFAP